MGLIVLGWLLLTNVVAFALMGIDKHQAKTTAWRIPEWSLFLIAIIGGSLGGWIGMEVFRHKTRKWSFKLGMPLILLFQLCLCIYANSGIF